MTPPAPRFRRATPADVGILCELGQQLNAIHHAARPDVFVAATGDFQRDAPHWLPALESESQAAFIAEIDTVPVGFITLNLLTPNTPLIRPHTMCRINSICVTEAMRGRGIGQALMRLAQSWAVQQGATSMTLNVWAFNADAVRLYEKLGFEVRALEMGQAL